MVRPLSTGSYGQTIGATLPLGRQRRPNQRNLFKLDPVNQNKVQTGPRTPTHGRGSISAPGNMSQRPGARELGARSTLLLTRHFTSAPHCIARPETRPPPLNVANLHLGRHVFPIRV